MVRPVVLALALLFWLNARPGGVSGQVLSTVSWEDWWTYDGISGIIDDAEYEDTICEERELLEKEHDNCIEGFLDYNNPFQKWGENIYENSKQLLHEGTGINAMYLPTLVSPIIKCIKLLPLWSGVMVPVFGYGEEISSSAAIESSFRKLKTITFKHIPLPTSIEEFLENHISSNRGASLIHSATNLNQSVTSSSTNQNTVNIIRESPCENNDEFCDMDEDDFLVVPKKLCPLCNAGSLPLKSGAHKCCICGVPVHALSTCSNKILENDELRVCFVCSLEDNITEENRACESWDRKNLKIKQSNSYLIPNPHLKHIDLNNSKNIKNLPIIKNGSRAEELKGCKSSYMDGNIVLTNTCAFDALASLIMITLTIAGPARTLVEGSDVQFLCLTKANPPEVNYRWFVNDQYALSEVTSELRLFNISRRLHNSFVRCEAQNSVEKTEESKALSILYKPQFKIRPKNVQADNGSYVTIMCDVDSNPPPTIEWTFEKTKKVLEDPIDDGVKSTLIIRKSVQEHFGTYNCTAHNEYGSDTIMIEKDFMLILAIIGAVGGIIVMILIFSVIGLCRRSTSQKKKKAKSDFNGESDADNKQNAAARESDASSNVSDIKMETSTGSSLSNYRYKIDYGADSLTVTTTATAVDDQHPRSTTPKSGAGSQTTLPRGGGGIPLAGPVPVDPRYATAAGYLGHMHPHNVMHHPLANGAVIGDYADPLNYVRYTNNHLATSPDGNITTSVLTFTPAIKDSDNTLSCRAESGKPDSVNNRHSGKPDGRQYQSQSTSILPMDGK